VAEGKAPRKPPLTREGRNALAEIGAKIGLISWQLTQLTEPALKGLAFEVRRTAEYGDEPGLWRGLADECDRQREILARHRTGKGVWYAVIELLYAEDRNTSRSVDLAYERCEGKKAAIEATRRLLAENASKFDDRVSVQPSVYCELEWTPPSD
jgi:hypothetical protein